MHFQLGGVLSPMEIADENFVPKLDFIRYCRWNMRLFVGIGLLFARGRRGPMERGVAFRSDCG
jgi:hypothetical protein